MDKVTAMTLDRGRKNNQLLIQPQYHPMPVAEQVAILYCGTHGLLQDVPLEKIADFQDRFLQTLRANHLQDVLVPLGEGKLTDEICQFIEQVAADVSGQYKQ